MSIFVSYRREDEPHAAGRLATDLNHQFGPDSVFFDEAMLPGTQWRHRVRSAIESASVMVIVIGKKWLGARKSGRQRLDREDDWVRLEIAGAITRGVVLIPVLIDEATIPNKADLPTALAALTDSQVHRINASSWERDSAHLRKALVKLVRPSNNVVPSASRDDRGPQVASAGTTGIQWALTGLGRGDRVLVVGRTCHYWLANEQQRSQLHAALKNGTQLTFVVQDLHDFLADPQFSALSQDLNQAEEGFRSLTSRLTVEERRLLSMRYSPTEIRNGRTIVYRNGQPSLVRYDLSMGSGFKPFVMIDNPRDAAVIAEEGVALESAAIPQADFHRATRNRRKEEAFRIGVKKAREIHPFSSIARGQSPERLVRQWARLQTAGEATPLSAQLLLTPRCTTHCAMCSYYAFADTGQTLDATEVIALFEDLAALGTRSVTLSGGEPLLFKDVESLLEKAAPLLKLGILTSGVVPVKRRDSIVSAVAEHCEWVQVSIDSFEEQGYRHIRVADKANLPQARLQTCSQFLHGLRESGFECRAEVCYTIQSRNVHELLNPYSLVSAIRAHVPAGVPVRFKFATGVPTDKTQDFRVDQESLRTLYEEWTRHQAALDGAGCNSGHVLSLLDRARESISTGYPMEATWRQLRDSPCQIMHYSMFIDFRGDVFPCCYLFNDNVASWDQRAAYAVGNWRKEKNDHPDQNALETIWRSRAFDNVRKKTLGQLPREACGRCTRHMQQNAFLAELTTRTEHITGAARDRGLSIFKDPGDPLSPPMWL